MPIWRAPASCRNQHCSKCQGAAACEQGSVSLAASYLLRPKVLVWKHRFLGVLDDHRSLQRCLMAGVAGIGQMAIVLRKLGFILVLDGEVELEQRVPYDGLDQFHDPLLTPLRPLERQTIERIRQLL